MKKFETVIEHEAHSTVFVVRTEYEWNSDSKTLTYQSFIEGESTSRMNSFRDFLKPHSEKFTHAMAGMQAVIAQHHKIECYLWAIDWQAIAIYGLRHPIDYYDNGGAIPV